ncbi:hypothetical protein Syun_019906 [Stephania yunnanensis]|uniref:NAC domain-containing protein n=1 Tax=Stephania yunnanensis TaxID=152371 RepID=A0AAP0NXT1_9MAGN
MSLTVDGQSQVPPGFRFHPTEEELLHYYLKKKVAYEKIDLDVIRDVDLNKLEPWDIQEKCKIGSTPQNDWYFFSHKDKKYPTGTRTNRATAAGFWKATGRDKVIYSSFKRIGMRKTLVFYKGRAPHGQKSDWIMHEYRLDDNTPTDAANNVASSMGEAAQEDGWVVCRVFKKKNHNKSFDNNSGNVSSFSSKTQMLDSSGDGALDQILQYMGRTCKKESSSAHDHQNANNNNNNNNIINAAAAATTNNNNSYLRFLTSMSDGVVNERFMPLPPLESPTLPSLPNDFTNSTDDHQDSISGGNHLNPVYHVDQTGMSHDWATLDRLVATHLNGQSESSKQMACFNDPMASNVNEHYLQLPQVLMRSSSSSSSSVLNHNNNRLLYNNIINDGHLHHHHHHDQGYNNNNNNNNNNSEVDLWNFTRSSSSSSDPLCHVSNSPVL